MTQEEERLIIIDICARIPFGLVVQQSPRYPTCRKKSYEADYDYITHDYEIFNCDVHGVLTWDPFRSDNHGCIYVHDKIKGQTCKPYLRKMSSMTDEERKESKEWIMLSIDSNHNKYFDGFGNISADDTLKAIDWLNEHHFDYRGLIEKGLAIEAPEKMYKI